MNELMNARNSRQDFRWQLLTTVSALALLASVNIHDAKAADQDADHPTIWIELGGQLEHVSGQGDNFPVAFLAANPNSPVLHPVSPLQAENPPPFEFAEEGKISFQPEGSDWVVSVAVNFGRSSNFKHVDHQTQGTYALSIAGHRSIHTAADFADTQVHRRESHAILDFSAGKDVGLGIFGRTGSSVLSLGVRFAQFTSKATFDVRARPDLVVNYKYGSFAGFPVKLPLAHFNTYHVTGQASRSFHGIGPSLSWNGSAPFAGTPQNGELSFDWGANAAVLFGRQKARVRHQESAHYEAPGCRAFGAGPCSSPYAVVYQHPVGGRDTDRSAIVPNLGGFAGASWRIENFKASIGYRADFFFGAIDGGIDTRKSETLGFYGPFASVSVGLGG
jgi:iron complex outermembrane recepter protein